MSLRYNEIEYIVNKGRIGAEREYLPFPHGIFEVRELNNTLKLVSVEKVKLNLLQLIIQ